MREAIHHCAELNENKRRLRDETLAARPNIRGRAYMLRGEEVDAWLAKLEAGEDTPPPECYT